MSCKQPGRMQGVELHAAGSQEVSLSYPYRTNIPILTIFLFFSTLSPQEGVMLMGLVASGGVSAGTTVLSHVIISHCASSRASLPRVQQPSITPRQRRKGEGCIHTHTHYTVLTSQLREARDDATSCFLDPLSRKKSGVSLPKMI